MDRKLATIRQISNIEPIEGADFIVKLTIDGWQCVGKKTDFNIGDLCVFFEIDSLLPEKECFEFMRERKFRVKTVKLKKQISQGLAFPIDILEKSYNKKFKRTLGSDLTEELGILKYDPQAIDESKLSENIRKTKNPVINFLLHFKTFRRFYLQNRNTAPFPSHLIGKTDEERIANLGTGFVTSRNTDWYQSEKLDGSSSSFIHNGKFFVCSRNLHLKKDDNSNYWKVAKKYDLEKNMKELRKRLKAKKIIVQGEILASNIQGNKYKVTEPMLYVFTITVDGERCGCKDMMAIAKVLKLETVPILQTDWKPSVNITMTDLVNMSKGFSKLDPKVLREGVVVRSNYNTKESFKSINPDFLLKNEE